MSEASTTKGTHNGVATNEHPTSDVRGASRKEWIGLAVLALPTLLLSIDVSVLYLALPRLSADLGASTTQQLWILDIYSFLLAGFLVTMGNLGDRVGRRKLLLIGAAAFGVASVVAAYATTPEMLIAARALLGIAGATLTPSTLALIRNMFHDPKQMGVAIGVWFSCFMGGMLVGPLVGGALLAHFWWGSAFLIGVPCMLVLLVAGPVLLPEYRDRAAGRLDLSSVALSLAAILPAIHGLKTLARDGWNPVAGATLVVGLAFGVTFVRRQRRLAEPLLDLRLFGSRSFSTAMAIMVFSGIVMAGVSLQTALYLQVVEEFTPLTAGLWQIPGSIAMVAGFMVAPKLADRFRPAYVVAAGLAVSGLGLLVLTQITGAGGLVLVVTGLVLASAGIALPMALTMNLVLASTSPEKAGAVSSVSETSGEFGIALGVASLGSLGAVVFRGALADTMPASAPTEVATTALEGITAATAAAHQLAGVPGHDLLVAAQTAFTAGLNVVALVGGLAFLGLAVLTIAVLRADRASDGTDLANNGTDRASDEATADATTCEPLPVTVA